MHRSIIGLSVIALLTAPGTVAFADPTMVRVPRGTAPQIDGSIDAKEWADAFQLRLTGGEALFLKCDAQAVYLAIRGAEDGWSHVYVADSSSIRVLHASAALGEAVYQKTEGTWSPAVEFSWGLRNSAQRTAAEKARYFEQHRWLANSVNRGAVREYRLPRSALAGASLAVVYASDAEKPSYWPDSLHDATVAPGLVRGSTPKDLSFDPRQWAVLQLAR